MSTGPPSKRSTIKRLPDRGTYEQKQILDILDEGLVAHVGIVQDGLPVVIPMGYARWGDKLLLHGSLSSRLMKVRQHDVNMPSVLTYYELHFNVTVQKQGTRSSSYRPLSIMPDIAEVQQVSMNNSRSNVAPCHLHHCIWHI